MKKFAVGTLVTALVIGVAGFALAHGPGGY